MTLLEKVTAEMARQMRKHDLGPRSHPEQLVNGMTNYEFLQALSDALENAGIMVPDE